MRGETIDLDRVPNEGVGPFVFGDAVEPLVPTGLLAFDPELRDPAHWDCDHLEDDAVSVHDEGGHVEPVHCDDRCLDLIGMSFDLVRSVLASEPGEQQVEAGDSQ